MTIFKKSTGYVMLGNPSISLTNKVHPDASLKYIQDSDIFSLLVENVKDYAIFVIDPSGYIVTWNKGAENIKGYTAEEIIGEHIRIFYSPEDNTNNVPFYNLQQAAATGRYEDEGWRIRKDGSQFWANVVFTALYQDDGSLKGFAKITRDITQRKQNEDKLAAMAALVNNTSDGVFSTTTSLHILTWNRSAEKLYGYSAEEVIGRTTLETIKPRITAEFLAERNKIIAERSFWNGEIIHTNKAGQEVIVSASISAIRNELNEVSSYIFIVRDKTAQKKAEERIAYLATIIENTSDAVFTCDAGYKILSWNKAAGQMFGYAPEEVIDKNVADILKTHITEAQRREIRGIIKERGEWVGELIPTQKNGSALYVYASLNVIRNSRDEIVEHIFVCKNITTKKKAEETEQRLKAQLDKLLNDKLDTTLKELADYKYALDRSSIVAITNQKGVIQFVNENFCKISGYEKEELIGKDHRLINSGYHNKAFIRSLWVTIGKGNIWKGELKNKAKNGDYYWVDTTIIPFLNDDGKPYQYVAIRADITERKKAEEALRLLNEELEERIKKRTNQLEIANKELEAFSYSVSHDLRAPLRSIAGFSKILEEDHGQKLDKEGLRLLGRIINNSVTMGRLIDDLLTFTRLGKIDAVSNNVDMNGLVRASIDEIAQNKNLSDYNIKVMQVPPCCGDANMLKQVWLNLIGNGVKYSSKKAQPEISIGASENELSVTYYIKDNGAGFDMQYYSKLFGVFQRLHDTNDFEGTGVGLALIKLIINKHGGDVWAEGKPGCGATFYFNLPK